MRLLGIDFGTCYIKGAEVKRNGDVVPLKLGKSIDKPRIPNVGLYEKKEDQPATILVGDIVLKRSAPEQDKIRNIKAYLQEYNWSRTLSFGQSVSAYEVTRDIMKNLYNEIHGSNKETDISAVITVPVNFSRRQQLMVKQAAEEAGFLINGVITEPFAAFFSLMQEEMEEDHNVMIFDFGGGTMDLCLVEVRQQEGNTRIETQSTVGISYGGNDINEDLLRELLCKREPDKIQAVLGPHNDAYHQMINRYYIMKSLDEMKEALFGSDAEEKAELLIERHVGAIQDFGEVTVEDVYQVLETQNWTKRIHRLLDGLFCDSDDMTADEVTDIYMVGGSSSIPYFRTILEEYFHKNGHEDVKTLFERNDEMDLEDRLYTTVANGAAIFNQLVTSGDEGIVIKDKIPFMVYTKDEAGRKLTPLMKNDSYKDYRSRLDRLTEAMKREMRIRVYQTIFGETEKEVYLGDIQLSQEIARQATMYQLMTDKDRNVLAELGYLDSEEGYEAEENRFCVDWRCKLEIDLT